MSSAGEAMLRRCMSEQQRREYATTGEFFVVGSLGGRFRIYGESYGRPRVLDLARSRFLNFWVNENACVPYHDHMLAQKLMLEHNEAEVRRIACESSYY